MSDFALICPRCSSPLSDWASGTQTCARCGTGFEIDDRIYRFLLPERIEELRPFLSQYRLVREQEGYRSRTPAYYRALPAVDPHNPLAENWRVRESSFNHLYRSILPSFDHYPLSILDLGAGNGWLCHRLSALGHRCAAVDWLADGEDGLGAHKHYPVQFSCFQADFDRLPFAPWQFDLVIFNASLHYSPDIIATLRNTAEMLSPGGGLAIMDSPTFRADDNGRRMVAEMEAKLKAQSGLTRVIQPGMGYLTPGLLKDAGKALGMEFHFRLSRGGLGWEIRRYLAGIKMRREPARLGMWVGMFRR
jgi:SAM-dependent methyltransferase